MKIVLGAALLLSVVSASANSGCKVDLEGGLRITRSALEFTDGEKARYKIVNDEILMLGERALPLDQQQQLLVKHYATNIRALVPEVKQLTLDGVDLASTAVGLIFQEFLAPDDKTVEHIRTEFSLLKKDIEKSFASGHPININQKGMRDNDYLGMGFESRISKIMEATGEKIGWNIVKSMGAAIFSDDKRGDFESRMNRFGERLEREMDSRAVQMEKRSNAVCDSVARLDKQEEELGKAIKEIKAFNFIRLKN